MGLKHIILTTSSALILLACQPEEAADTAAEEVAQVPAVEETAIEVANEVSALEAALAGDWRVAPERDEWRHPEETLEFFGVEADDTVVEIWPGGGWYTSVLGPYLKTGGGTLIAAGMDPESSDYAKNWYEKFSSTFASNPDVYGDIQITVASKDAAGMAPEGSADYVLTFRNVHNWMKGSYADKMFADAYKALKPGGILGVVEHRLPSASTQDPEGKSGYVQESLVRQFAEEAGFEFVESSEINANPADTADHPFGVWTLPPVSRSAPRGEEPAADFDGAKYLAIGESDRMTLKFVKPAADAE